MSLGKTLHRLVVEKGFVSALFVLAYLPKPPYVWSGLIELIWAAAVVVSGILDALFFITDLEAHEDEQWQSA